MTSNFDFLQQNKKFRSFACACLEAEKSIAVSPATTAILSRRALELAVKWLYSSDSDLKIPYQDNLSSLIHDRSFQDIMEPELFPLVKYVVKLGNMAAHTSSPIKREEAVLSLHNLHQFVSWIDYCYSEDYQESKFREEDLPTGEEKKVPQEELEKLFNQLGTKDKKLRDIILENEQLREELSKLREKNIQEQDFQVDQISEFETRKRYIDLELKEAGWILGEDCLEEFPVEGMPYGSGQGYVDYVLLGDNGKPLAVVEAKRTSKDPKIGEQQAKLYAECLEKRFQQRPVIFYTNGLETYLWDDTLYPSRRVAGFYAKEELQLLVDRRINRTPLKNITIKEQISNRYYQKEAIRAVCDSLEEGNRKVLLVMATGSGKTRTVISLVDVLTRHDWVKNVLFLADRTALVRQGKNNFNYLLPNMSLGNLLDSKDSPESRIIFSTYPTMMNAIDETKAKNGKKLFTVGHFDLVVVDESHRSIYKKYQAIFDYFDALLVGLTATPKDEIDKNTYHIFDLENNVPTYAYELEEAVKDKFLVPYKTVETQLKFLEEGIYYDQLSQAEKETFEETFADDVPDFISSEALNQWLFNDDTIDKVLSLLMEKGIKVEGGDKLGKTIIFAKSHQHAVRIVERFNSLYPGYKGEFARVIDNQVNYSQDLIDKLADRNKFPQLAVSVDMLDTGIDIPEVVNLVFFKKVRSKAKFWQMIGRGTRLCEDLFGVGIHKEYFYIFDFCGNFEFFRANPNGIEVKTQESLTEKNFNTKVELIRELQHLDYQQEEYLNYRNKLIGEVLGDIKALNRSHFVVKQHLKYVDQFSNLDKWKQIGIIDTQDIKEHLGPLIISNEEDELAKRFDYLMFGIELAQLTRKNANKAKDNVVKTAHALSGLGTIPQVLAKKEIIEKVQTDAFWANATLPDYEEVRMALRDLIKFLERARTKIYYTNFSDEILAMEEKEAEYTTSNLESYRKKVDAYLREHQDHIAIFKLKTNKQLTKQDFAELEKILWGDLGTKDDYLKEFGDTPLSILVRQVVGLDQKAANEAFSEFLSNQTLAARQIRFVKVIIDYIVKNGHMLDKKALQEDPFKSIGSIIEVFPTDEAVKIVNVIDTINKNAIEIVGA